MNPLYKATLSIHKGNLKGNTRPNEHKTPMIMEQDVAFFPPPYGADLLAWLEQLIAEDEERFTCD